MVNPGLAAVREKGALSRNRTREAIHHSRRPTLSPIIVAQVQQPQAPAPPIRRKRWKRAFEQQVT